MISFSLTKPRSPGIPGFCTEVWLPFLFHRQLLHGLAATAGIPLRAEQRSNAFRGRVEKSVSLRYGESGQIKLDRKFRRSGISHRLPRTGSHPFVLRIVAVGSVFVRPSFESVTRLRNARAASCRADVDEAGRIRIRVGRKGPIQLLLGNRHAAALFQKMAHCCIMSQTPTRKAQAFFVCIAVHAGSTQSWVPTRTRTDRKRISCALRSKVG